MREKSIGKNAILNIIKQCCSVVFPLLTFPYISQHLGVDTYGTFNFVNSVVNYFVIFAALGVNTYAVREGSRLKNKKEDFAQFVNEVFTINVFSALVSIISMAILLLFWNRLNKYMLLVLVLGLSIILNTVGLDWVNNIMEDFEYITIRYIIFQLLALIFILIFVRKPSDILKYTFIYVFANAGPGLLNMFYIRRYVEPKLVLSLGLKCHLKPMLLLLCNTFAVSIYVNSDLTLIGIIKSNYEVGLYSVAAKIYNIVKQLLNAFCVVVIPRISYYISCDCKQEYNKLLNKTFYVLMGLVMPAIVGLFFLSKDIIIIISGNEYVNGTASLQILCISLLFSVLACFFSTVILIPNRCEKIVLISTLISAAANFILNYLFISRLGIEGAAITTVISEFIVMIITMYYSKNLWIMDKQIKNFISYIIGCIGIGTILCIVSGIINNILIRVFISIVLCIAFYMGILIIFNHRILRRGGIRK